MKEHLIMASISKLKNSLPPGVLLVAAAKTRTPEEVKIAIRYVLNVIKY